MPKRELFGAMGRIGCVFSSGSERTFIHWLSKSGRVLRGKNKYTPLFYSSRNDSERVR